MIKVLNVISDTNIGGAGKCVINFCRNYDPAKLDLAVVVPNGSKLIEELKNTKARVIEIDGLKDKSLDLSALFKLIKLFKKEKPDLVHTHASSVARIAARFVGHTKIVYTRHCVYPVSDKIKKGIGKFLYKNINEYFSDRIIAVGNAAEENLLEGGISKEKIDTFVNGVEKIGIISNEEKNKLREKYGISKDEFVIGIVARLEKVKGHEIFIEAAKILLEEKKLNAKFIIMGTGSEEENLKQKVKDLNLENKVIFTGFVKNVGDFLNIFDVQVNCSYGTEAASLSLLEGMSIGIPAVASDYGGNPYLIFNDENGYIVPKHSPRETAEAIYKIVSNSDIKNRMKDDAIKIFEEKFNMKKYVDNIEGVYEKAMLEKKSKKINLFDIFVILFALIIALVGYKFLKNTDNGSIANLNDKVVYEVELRETIPEVYNMIEIGSSVYDGQKNFYIGTVIDKSCNNAVEYALDMSNGIMVKNELEDKLNIKLKIEANCTKNEKNISIGDLDVKIGSESYVKGKGYAAKGYIVAIER